MYQPLPPSRPSTPPNRSPNRSRSFNRSSPPDSLTLSPASVYSYSETDAFLSPRTGPPTPSTPGSPFLSPTFFHPQNSSQAISLGSPLTLELEKTSRGYFELKLPPTAKRTRKSKSWLVMGIGLVIVVGCVGVMSVYGGIGQERLEAYSTRVGEKMASLKESVKEKWGSSQEEIEVKDVQEEPLILVEPTLFDSAEPTAALPLGELFEIVAKEEEQVDETGPIRISTLPSPRLPPTDSSETRYLGFLPHSGYHNQRIAFQNALLLGKLLNRTVLLPPLWVGWPISTEPYDDLAKSWTDIMNLNPTSFNLSTLTDSSPLNLAANYSSTVSSFPCPSCAADNSTLVEAHLAGLAKNREKWVSQGFEVRPDGYPITNLTASECKSYSPECRHTYRDTFLSYDFVVDLEKVREVGVEVVDRWDMRERAIEGLLGVEEKDIYVIKDRQAYDFLFTDRNVTSSSPLITPHPADGSHWNRDVSIPTLATLPHKVLLFGSLFGGGRIESDHPLAQEWSESFARAMAFKNEWLLTPAEAIVDRLGGQKNYVGVHARVGDGEFKRHAKANMEEAWKELVRSLEVDESVMEEMWEEVKPKEHVAVEGDGRSKRKIHADAARSLKKRSSTPIMFSSSPWSHVDEDYSSLITSPPSRSRQSRRSLHKRAADDDVWSFLKGPTQESSALFRNLNCRSPLHTDPRLKLFNTPLYLATDSRDPTTDDNLKPFFLSFPCSFILSDFDRVDEERNDGVIVESVGEMGRLENELDGVPLGRLFLPFLEAIIAAKGRITVGTAHSTFSSFAAGPLHDAYWE